MNHPAHREGAECALWFTTWSGPDYWLEDSEADAATAAASLEHHDDVHDILGVQFPDGRLVKAVEWQAFRQARLRYAERQRRQRDMPPIPERDALDPFTGAKLRIETSEPAWLGRQ